MKKNIHSCNKHSLNRLLAKTFGFVDLKLRVSTLMYKMNTQIKWYKRLELNPHQTVVIINYAFMYIVLININWLWSLSSVLMFVFKFDVKWKHSHDNEFFIRTWEKYFVRTVFRGHKHPGYNYVPLNSIENYAIYIVASKCIVTIWIYASHITACSNPVTKFL